MNLKEANQGELNQIANVKRDFPFDSADEFSEFPFFLVARGIDRQKFGIAMDAMDRRRREINDDGWLAGEVNWDADTVEESFAYLKTYIS